MLFVRVYKLMTNLILQTRREHCNSHNGTGDILSNSAPANPKLDAMSTQSLIPPEMSKTTIQNTASLLRIVALGLISGAAISSRLFAVINFESIIHELYV